MSRKRLSMGGKMKPKRRKSLEKSSVKPFSFSLTALDGDIRPRRMSSPLTETGVRVRLSRSGSLSSSGGAIRPRRRSEPKKQKYVDESSMKKKADENSSVSKKVMDLKDELQEKKEDYRHLKKKFEEQAKKMDVLRKKNKSLKGKVKTLKKRNQELEKKNKRLKNEVSITGKKMTHFKKAFERGLKKPGNTSTSEGSSDESSDSDSDYGLD